MLKLTQLNLNEKNTFGKHVTYMLMEGVILGVLALNEFVFIKSLNGSNYQLGFLFQFSMIVFLFLILINEFLKRVKSRKRLLQWVGWITRLPLAIIFLFPHTQEEIQAKPYFHYVFLSLFLLYFFGNIFIYPNINYLLKNNYSHKNFGRLYSYATSLNKIIMLIITFLYGWWLDLNHFAFVYIFPFIGVLGVASLYVLSSIPFPANSDQTSSRSVWSAVKKSVQEMSTILKTNLPYRHFEAGFMLYGFSFMISVTVITLYFYNGLNLSYSSVAFYKNAYNILAIILLPFFGKVLGNIDPRKFAAFTFGSVGMYIFAVILTRWSPYRLEFYGITVYITLMFYVLFHGIFAATMSLLWNIGSAYFCKPEEAGTYQSLHLSLTGLRALAAPLLGVFFYEMLGFTVTFVIAFLFSAGAVALMIWSWKKEKVPLNF